MLVLCQRFESKAEQRAPWATLKNEQHNTKSLPPADIQIKNDSEEKTSFEEFSDDEDEGSIYYLEEKEVGIYSYCRLPFMCC